MLTTSILLKRGLPICGLFIILGVLVTKVLNSLTAGCGAGNAGSAAQIAGKTWRYDVNFPVYNAPIIARLIECESKGRNEGRPDSNGQVSWGILQFNGRSTWQEMEKRFHFYGDPRNPPDAIHMADMMISSGMVGRWSCARSLGITK